MSLIKLKDCLDNGEHFNLIRIRLGKVPVTVFEADGTALGGMMMCSHCHTLFVTEGD